MKKLCIFLVGAAALTFGLTANATYHSGIGNNSGYNFSQDPVMFGGFRLLQKHKNRKPGQRYGSYGHGPRYGSYGHGPRYGSNGNSRKPVYFPLGKGKGKGKGKQGNGRKPSFNKPLVKPTPSVLSSSTEVRKPSKPTAPVIPVVVAPEVSTTPAAPTKAVPVPEPGTVGLLAMGLIGLVVARKRANRS